MDDAAAVRARGGSVPQLKVTNRGAPTVLLVAGEERVQPRRSLGSIAVRERSSVRDALPDCGVSR